MGKLLSIHTDASQSITSAFYKKKKKGKFELVIAFHDALAAARTSVAITLQKGTESISLPSQKIAMKHGEKSITLKFGMDQKPTGKRIEARFSHDNKHLFTCIHPFKNMIKVL